MIFFFIFRSPPSVNLISFEDFWTSGWIDILLALGLGEARVDGQLVTHGRNIQFWQLILIGRFIIFNKWFEICGSTIWVSAFIAGCIFSSSTGEVGGREGACPNPSRWIPPRLSSSPSQRICSIRHLRPTGNGVPRFVVRGWTRTKLFQGAWQLKGYRGGAFEEMWMRFNMGRKIVSINIFTK